jgi:hypothetical protein
LLTSWPCSAQHIPSTGVARGSRTAGAWTSWGPRHWLPVCSWCPGRTQILHSVFSFSSPLQLLWCSLSSASATYYLGILTIINPDSRIWLIVTTKIHFDTASCPQTYLTCWEIGGVNIKLKLILPSRYKLLIKYLA